MRTCTHAFMYVYTASTKKAKTQSIYKMVNLYAHKHS